MLILTLYILLYETASAKGIYKMGMVSRFQRYIAYKTSASKLCIENKMKKIYCLSLIRHQLDLWNKKHWKTHLQNIWLPSLHWDTVCNAHNLVWILLAVVKLFQFFSIPHRYQVVTNTIVVHIDWFLFLTCYK